MARSKLAPAGSRFRANNFDSDEEIPSEQKVSTETSEQSNESVTDSSDSSDSSEINAVSSKNVVAKTKKSKFLETDTNSSDLSDSGEISTVPNKTVEKLIKSKSPEIARDSNASTQKKEPNKKSAVKNKSQAKINSNDIKLAKELSCINFPLDVDYDFRLVCTQCLVKEKEGVNAFYLKKMCPTCALDQLVIKKKSKNSWLLVRNRPPFCSIYEMCPDFKRCVPCKQKPCTFAHGEGERLLWTYELEKKFQLDTFIKVLRKNDVVTSQELVEVKSKTTYIPGLTNSTTLKCLPDRCIENSASTTTNLTDRATDVIGRKHMQPSLDSAPITKLDDLPPLPDLVMEAMKSESSKLELSNSNSTTLPKCASLDLSLKPVSVEYWPFTNENPLQKTHDFRMFCGECFPHTFMTTSPHTNCLKNILAFAEKGTSHWLEVRERKKLATFNRYYTLCRSLTEDRSLCTSDQKHCPFAHNTIELLLWNADKEEKFDLTKFFYSEFSDKYRLLTFITKYGTSFSFICGACFESSRLIVHQHKSGIVCEGLEAHCWSSHKTLFYAAEKTIINKVHKLCLYRRCFDKNCKRTCSLAHSTVEREVWILLNVANITEEKFVEEIKSYSRCFVGKKGRCPYELLPLCERCFAKYPNIPDKECNYWRKSSRIYITIPGLKRIRSLPSTNPKEFQIDHECKSPHNCTAAHSQEEYDVWKWMHINGIKNLQKIFSDQASNEQELPPLLAADEMPESSYSCAYCGVWYAGKIQYDEHCTTNHHHYRRVTNDEEQQWNCRQPPFLETCKKKHIYLEKDIQIELCEAHKTRQCVYSGTPDISNMCPNAHGHEEFMEWKKRYKLHLLKINMSKMPRMSYLVKLQKIYKESLTPFNVMRNNIPDVQVEVIGDTSILSVEKKLSYTWKIIVTSQTKELQKVSLFHDKDRLYFMLTTDFNKSKYQILDGHLCKQKGLINRWEVTISFNANTYGSFRQRVIFDFGDKPLLFQDLMVELGKYHEIQQLLTNYEETQFLVWTPENREIIFLEEESDLMKKYKQPTSIESILTHEVTSTKLNRHNYVQKMHKLLYLEEFARQQKMARYSLNGFMFVTDRIVEGPMHFQRPNEYYTKIHLPEELSEDTDIGRLILNNCTSVFINLPTAGSKVYEVEIFKDDYRYFKGHNRNSIYLTLTKSCMLDLGLRRDSFCPIETQFQLNRRPFCLMHFALDNIDRDCINMLFPNPIMYPLGYEVKAVEYGCNFLNQEQLHAVNYSVNPQKNDPRPFILNGAYGTGKTETLAQTTMWLLDKQPKAKILICTQCNSSADLFIVKHLDDYLEKQGRENTLLRLYYCGRRISSIPNIVRKYISLPPTQDEFIQTIKHHQVVICTLENCHELIKLNIKHFTHIFVDEAAQEFEAKILLPLCLSSSSTHIILSGDRHQMGVKIHSTEARRLGLGTSIMQRLFDHYEKHHPPNAITNSSLHTLLMENYRSVSEITRFISTCFYGITIETKNNMPTIPNLKPLQFYAVCGTEAYHSDIPSYFNMKEIQQAVNCVMSVASTWPDMLGPFEPKSICVVSAYKEQIIQIRNHLRNLYIGSKTLADVTVEHVENLPGKEFNVIIISTVRTRRFFNISSENLANYCDETNKFGFFFNKKLLNTAMTRAKYAIIVVGDPVALIGYGKCSTIWRMFMHHCNKLRSIHPPHLTFDAMQYELNNLLANREICSQ